MGFAFEFDAKNNVLRGLVLFVCFDAGTYAIYTRLLPAGRNASYLE